MVKLGIKVDVERRNKSKIWAFLIEFRYEYFFVQSEIANEPLRQLPNGQGDREHSPCTFRTLHFDLTAMCLHNVIAQTEA
jgi:hypothetical protein